MKTKRFAGMELGPQKRFDTSGKSGAHFQHPAVCQLPASRVPRMLRPLIRVILFD